MVTVRGVWQQVVSGAVRAGTGDGRWAWVGSHREWKGEEANGANQGTLLASSAAITQCHRLWASTTESYFIPVWSPDVREQGATVVGFW